MTAETTGRDALTWNSFSRGNSGFPPSPLLPGLWRLHPLTSRRCISAGPASIVRSPATVRRYPPPAHPLACGCSLFRLSFLFLPPPPSRERCPPPPRHPHTHPRKHALDSPRPYLTAPAGEHVIMISCARALARRGASGQAGGKPALGLSGFRTTGIDAGDRRTLRDARHPPTAAR